MSTLSEFNQQAARETDREHQIQLGLLEALCAATSDAQAAVPVAEILQQLISYSEAHFMSEELLMRLHSYDDYEDHVSDHIDMMDRLNAIAAAQSSGGSALVSGNAREVLAFLNQHIATRDQRFAVFMRAGK
jgi:hemerythrin